MVQVVRLWAEGFKAGLRFKLADRWGFRAQNTASEPDGHPAGGVRRNEGGEPI
jgi:hypothetical protein